MFHRRDDRDVKKWKEKRAAVQQDFAARSRVRLAGTPQLPESGRYAGSYAELGERCDTTYDINFEPMEHGARSISGSVQDEDGAAMIAEGVLLPDGSCYWVEVSEAGNLEPKMGKFMTPATGNSGVTDFEATTLHALVTAKYVPSEGRIIGEYVANTGEGGNMWIATGPPAAQAVGFLPDTDPSTIPVAALVD